MKTRFDTDEVKSCAYRFRLDTFCPRSGNAFPVRQDGWPKALQTGTSVPGPVHTDFYGEGRTTMRVGVIGLGIMGQAIATRLLAAEHSVTVYNRTREKAEALLAKGAFW